MFLCVFIKCLIEVKIPTGKEICDMHSLLIIRKQILRCKYRSAKGEPSAPSNPHVLGRHAGRALQDHTRLPGASASLAECRCCTKLTSESYLPLCSLSAIQSCLVSVFFTFYRLRELHVLKTQNALTKSWVHLSSGHIVQYFPTLPSRARWPCD